MVRMMSGSTHGWHSRQSPNVSRGPEPKGQHREVEALGWTDENRGPGTTD